MNNIRLLDSLLKRMDARTETIVVTEPFVSAPERCILIFDRSGSMATNDYLPTRLLAAFDAGIEFLHARKATGLPDLISVVLFDNAAEFVCRDVSLNKAVEILTRLKSKNPIRGGTDINSGLVAAESHYEQERQNYSNRIVLLTDGNGGNPICTARRLHKTGVLVDVIGIAGTPEDVAEEEMRKVASFIKGTSRYRFIGNKAELLQHFKTIATDLMRVK